MGFYRAFTQPQQIIETGSTVEWPNSATVTEVAISGTTPVLIAADRTTTLSRRKLIIENDGATPIIFSLSNANTLSPTRKTGILYPAASSSSAGDTYIDDSPCWQGQVWAASTTGTTGTVNVTEAIVII